MVSLRTLVSSFVCLFLVTTCGAENSQRSAAETKSQAEHHDHPANRLAKETSPYLLLHAHNPVDWYAWGPEAFEKAKRENKPIFLSIGYSSCYWCHVMERESFSDEEIAAYMNEHFVNIKVDREERPDVDDIYMIALQVYQQAIGSDQGGGWPLSMFLTPTGKPIAGGTYFPPTEQRGIPGFLALCKQLQASWETNQERMIGASEILARNVQRATAPKVDLSPVPLDESLVTVSVQAIKDQFDPEYGGLDFNPRRPTSPKFPVPTRLMLLQSQIENDADGRIAEMLDTTLDHMLRGGIRDHLGGGFHRYSTDRQWMVPHFEKMLYDNAQLSEVFTAEYARTGEQRYLNVAEETFEFILRQMTDSNGGFYSALDAETDGIEGQHYVWSKEELATALGAEDAALFDEVYGFNEPSEFEHGHVLHLPKSIADSAASHDMTEVDLQERLKNLREQLLTTREKRPALLKDDKILTSWNGLMIRALARGGHLLDRPDLIEAADKASNFILTEMRDDEGRLLRTHREKLSKLNAYLDDYAFLVDGLLSLHAVTGQEKWLTAAKDLTDDQIDLFWDDEGHGFFFTSDHHEELLARTKNAYDSVLPSGNSVSVRNLVRLADLTENDEYHDRARQTLEVFAGRMKEQPGSMTFMALALDDYLTSTRGEARNSETSSLDIADEGEEVSKSGGTTVTASKFPLQGANADEPLIVAARTDPRDQDAKVDAKAYLSVDQLPAGGTAEVAVALKIKRDWHINANPASDDFLIPTELKLDSRQELKLSDVVYPKGHDFRMSGFDDTIAVYEKLVIFKGKISVPEAAAGKTDEVKLTVHYQACNDRNCLRPTDAVLTFKVPVAAAGASVKPINQRLFQSEQLNP
ncbi:MAG: DUF255 domain-containing protein [Planctomycetaceae bacterium]|nr:DUF255 domain-containing protein [Planctomycetaceae bacterium]